MGLMMGLLVVTMVRLMVVTYDGVDGGYDGEVDGGYDGEVDGGYDGVDDGAVGGYNGGVDGGCANKVSLFCRWQPRSWISNFLMSGVFAQKPSPIPLIVVIIIVIMTILHYFG